MRAGKSFSMIRAPQTHCGGLWMRPGKTSSMDKSRTRTLPILPRRDESRTTRRYWKLFDALPEDVQNRAPKLGGNGAPTRLTLLSSSSELAKPSQSTPFGSESITALSVSSRRTPSHGFGSALTTNMSAFWASRCGTALGRHGGPLSRVALSRARALMFVHGHQQPLADRARAAEPHRR